MGCLEDEDDILDFLVLIKSLLVENNHNLTVKEDDGGKAGECIIIKFLKDGYITISFYLIVSLNAYLHRVVECEELITSSTEMSLLSEYLASAKNVINESRQFFGDQIFSLMVVLISLLRISLFYLICTLSKGPTNMGSHGSETTFNQKCPRCH